MNITQKLHTKCNYQYLEIKSINNKIGAIFVISGPKYIITVNWDLDHKHAVTLYNR